MAYSELIKDFGRIRDYMREFFVYGFKSRDEYTRKSSRSYDDERRRLAYKSLEDTIDVIRESVEIIEIIKPVYNFKASEDDRPGRGRKPVAMEFEEEEDD